MNNGTVLIEKKKPTKKPPLHQDRKTAQILNSYVRELIEMSQRDKTCIKDRTVYSCSRNLQQVRANGREIAWIGGEHWVRGESLMRSMMQNVEEGLRHYCIQENVISADMKELKVVWDSVLYLIAKSSEV